MIKRGLRFNVAFQGFRIHTHIPYIHDTDSIRRRVIYINQLEVLHQCRTSVDAASVKQKRLAREWFWELTYRVLNLFLPGEPTGSSSGTELMKDIINVSDKQKPSSLIPLYRSHGYWWWSSLSNCSEVTHFSGSSCPASTSSRSASISAIRASKTSGSSV